MNMFWSSGQNKNLHPKSRSAKRRVGDLVDSNRAFRP